MVRAVDALLNSVECPGGFTLDCPPCALLDFLLKLEQATHGVNKTIRKKKILIKNTTHDGVGKNNLQITNHQATCHKNENLTTL